MRSPTLLVYDDIHWADASLLDLLETFAARVRDVPVLFLALARPELLGERPGWGGGLPAYTALPLEPLAGRRGSRARHRAPRARRRDDAGGAGRGDCGGQPALHRRARQVPRRAASHGTRRAADEHPRDHRRAAGRTSGRGARRARRRVRRRPRVLARRTVRDRGPRDDLSAVLGSLEARDLIQREAVSRIKGDQQFGFKHGLIHDVAYGTLPRAARQSQARGGRALPRGGDRRGPVARGARAPLARRGRERARRRAPDRRRRPGGSRLGEATGGRALPRGARATRRGRRGPARDHAEARRSAAGRVPPRRRRRRRVGERWLDRDRR